MRDNKNTFGKVHGRVYVAQLDIVRSERERQESEKEMNDLDERIKEILSTREPIEPPVPFEETEMYKQSVEFSKYIDRQLVKYQSSLEASEEESRQHAADTLRRIEERRKRVRQHDPD